MPEYPIKLGQKSHPISISPMTEPGDVHYPTLFLQWKKDYDLPDEGEMVVKFKKTRETTDNSGEKKHYEVSLEIHEIVSVEAMECEECSEDALDKLAEDYDKEGED